jgi:hypothetical protein
MVTLDCAKAEVAAKAASATRVCDFYLKGSFKRFSNGFKLIIPFTFIQK